MFWKWLVIDSAKNCFSFEFWLCGLFGDDADAGLFPEGNFDNLADF